MNTIITSHGQFKPIRQTNLKYLPCTLLFFLNIRQLLCQENLENQKMDLNETYTRRKKIPIFIRYTRLVYTFIYEINKQDLFIVTPRQQNYFGCSSHTKSTSLHSKRFRGVLCVFRCLNARGLGRERENGGREEGVPIPVGSKREKRPKRQRKRLVRKIKENKYLFLKIT